MQTYPRKHIVDALIEERAPSLFGHPLGRALMRHVLYPLLDYRGAVRKTDEIAGLTGAEIMAKGVRDLEMDVRTLGLSRLPPNGRVVIVPNHPTGLADGVAVWEAIRRVRHDMWILANRDAIRFGPGLGQLMIPVQWEKHKRNPAGTRRILADVGNALRGEAAVVFFASGRIAHMTLRGLRERPWLGTAVALARKHKAPILPLHIRARNSWLFYGLSQLSTELRDVTLFNELLNKRGRRFELTFGDLIDPQDLPEDVSEAAVLLQRHVEDELPRASRSRPAVPKRASGLARPRLSRGTPA